MIKNLLSSINSNKQSLNEETILLGYLYKDKNQQNYSELKDLDVDFKFQRLNENEVYDDLSGLNDEYDGEDQIDEWNAGFNVTNAIQGMFVVSLPYAVANGGYWALLAMLFVSYICCYTGEILIDCLYDDDKRERRIRACYVDIAKDVWGSRMGAHIVNLAQNIELLMTCILYLVLCGDLLVGTFPNYILDHTSWTMISCMILVPCAFIKSLKLISKLSLCNAVVHFIINAIIIIYCLMSYSKWNLHKSMRDMANINIWSFPISLGIIVFSYTSQIFLPTLEGSMSNKKQFNRMLVITHIIAAIFKALFGLFGYLTWQEETDEIITNNLPTLELKMLVNLILVLKALLSYPLPYYASIELLETTLFKPNIHRRRTSTYSLSNNIFATCYDYNNDLKFWAICLRISLILFTLVMAVFLPHFAILMGLIGSITGTMLSLIWPCYFHLRLKWNNLKLHRIVIDIAIIIFGLFITVIGVYYSSIALVEAIKNQNSKTKLLHIKNNFYLSSRNTTVYHN